MKKKLSLNEEIFDIIDEFTFFDDWSDKYQHLIDQGKKIERIEENLKIEKNKRGVSVEIIKLPIDTPGITNHKNNVIFPIV